MSLTLHVLSEPGRIPTGRDLKAELARRGWATRILDMVGKPLADEDGPNDGELTVVGWPADAANAAEIEQAAAKGDGPDLAPLFKAGTVGACGISLGGEFAYEELWEDEELLDEEFDEDDRPPSRAEFEVETPAPIVEYLKRSKARHYVRTTMSRSRLSSRLQDDVWESLARLTGGLMELEEGFQFATPEPSA